MIEKKDFYRGSVLHELLEYNRKMSVKIEGEGYIINGNSYLYIKYSTKNRTPWGFALSDDEADVIHRFSKRYDAILALVCGGDGICIINHRVLTNICGRKGGWISVRRTHGRMYSVAGPVAEHTRKVPCKPLLKLKAEKKNYDQIPNNS